MKEQVDTKPACLFLCAFTCALTQRISEDPANLKCVGPPTCPNGMRSIANECAYFRTNGSNLGDSELESWKTSLCPSADHDWDCRCSEGLYSDQTKIAVSNIEVGHFTQSSSLEALVSFSGCKGVEHALLRKGTNQWERSDEDYNIGTDLLITGRPSESYQGPVCERVDLQNRTRFICVHEEIDDDIVEGTIQFHTFHLGGVESTELTRIHDEFTNCSVGTWKRRLMPKSFSVTDAGDHKRLKVSFNATLLSILSNSEPCTVDLNKYETATQQLLLKYQFVDGRPDLDPQSKPIFLEMQNLLNTELKIKGSETERIRRVRRPLY